MFHLNHTLATLRISTSKGKMIRISRNVHGASSPFKQDSTEYHHARARVRNKNIKCNVQAGVVTHHKPTEPMRCNVQSRQAMVQNKIRQVKSNINSNNTNNNRKSPPLKEIQSIASKQHVSDSSDHSDSEVNLFAGSKSYHTPSPSELPKPPKNWMINLCVLGSMDQCIISPDISMNVEHDSAILVVGTKTDNSLKALKTKMK